MAPFLCITVTGYHFSLDTPFSESRSPAPGQDRAARHWPERIAFCVFPIHMLSLMPSNRNL